MSGCNLLDQSPTPFVGRPLSEADLISQQLRSLREQIVTAWRERAVILSAEEQAALQADIKRTCDVLTELTRFA